MIDKSLDTRHYQVNYLVPDKVVKEYKNAPRLMCQRVGGVWQDGSVWIMTASQAAVVEWRKEEWEKAGIGIWFTPFDPAEKERTRQMVRYLLESQVGMWRDRIDETLDETRKRISEIEKQGGGELSYERARSYFKNRIREFKTRFSQIRMAALKFDLTGSVDKLVEAEVKVMAAKTDADEFSVLRAKERLRKARKLLTDEQLEYISRSLRQGVPHEEIVKSLQEEGAVV